MNESIAINVSRIEGIHPFGGSNRIPAGKRGRQKLLLKKKIARKRGIVTVRGDGLCFARSLVVGKAIGDGIADLPDKGRWRAITRKDARRTQY